MAREIAIEISLGAIYCRKHMQGIEWRAKEGV